MTKTLTVLVICLVASSIYLGIQLQAAVVLSTQYRDLTQKAEDLDTVDQANEATCISYLKEANAIIQVYQQQ